MGIAGVGIPPQEALDPLKVICLRNTCSEVQSAEILASLPLFQNLRALHLDFTATARAEVGDLHPLTSLTKLQALRLGISRPWSAALCDNLKQTIQNTQLREISLETSLFKVRTNQFVCDALKDHPFHHMSILGFKIKTLAAFDVSCLKTFSLNI